MKGKERPIVVRFAFQHSRDEWIHRFKEEALHDASGPGISLKQLEPDQPQGRLTAVDHLAQHTLELLKKTRDVALQREYKYVWTRNGSIFVRKGDSAVAWKIITLDDIDKL
ncbi:hypothetical protein C0J52_27925 [Blattella germanica]|nr:hypothetical protein C0J52_27925 [Blattella germanica]